jgi:hypothetical protein
MRSNLEAKNMRRARLQIILLVALGAALLLSFLDQERMLSGGISGLPLDDAWIHVRFADNLRNGRGFAFNPGEPTAGSTSPVWVLLLAISGSGYVLPAKLIGAACYIATGLFVPRILLHLGFTKWEGFLGGSLALATGRST